MLLICPSCKTKNFLDPYPFWNFEGTTKCASCKGIWRLKTVSGVCVSGPEKATGEPTLLPGFAETQNYEPISGPGVTRPAPRARKDSACRPIPMEKNIRGNPISGHPLKKEDLVGSRSKALAATA